MESGAAEHKYSEGRCEIALTPSRRCAWLLACAALATEALIAVTPGSSSVRILAATWIACAALEAVHSRALLRGPRGARRITLDRDGAIEVEDAAGRSRAGAVCEGCFVAPWLTIVLWKPQRARFVRAVPIAGDMAAAEELRRLRVLLRWA